MFKDDNLYLFVVGETGFGSTQVTNVGGYNGVEEEMPGGTGMVIVYTGGGATDIRLSNGIGIILIP